MARWRTGSFSHIVVLYSSSSSPGSNGLGDGGRGIGKGPGFSMILVVGSMCPPHPSNVCIVYRYITRGLWYYKSITISVRNAMYIFPGAGKRKKILKSRGTRKNGYHWYFGDQRRDIYGRQDGNHSCEGQKKGNDQKEEQGPPKIAPPQAQLENSFFNIHIPGSAAARHGYRYCSHRSQYQRLHWGTTDTVRPHRGHNGNCGWCAWKTINTMPWPFRKSRKHDLSSMPRNLGCGSRQNIGCSH